MSDIICKLQVIADMRAHVDVINLEFDAMKAAVLTPEQMQQLVEIDEERCTALDAVRAGIATLEQEVKADVLQLGTSVKAHGLHAVYSAGRASWDTKALDGYAAAHPEIMPFRKVGAPTVSLRST